MIYDLGIDERNKQCHLDIERDIQKQANGTFTFTLRLNAGSVIDYTVTEYADSSKYLRLNRIIIEQLTATLNTEPRDS